MIRLDQLCAFLGEPKLRAMTSAFYRRIREDEILGPLYPQEDWDGAERRLADFLVYRFGGPEHYLQERGHPRLRMRHMPFSIGAEERDRWLKLMTDAMHETDIPEEAALTRRPFFEQVADMMRNRQERD